VWTFGPFFREMLLGRILKKLRGSFLDYVWANETAGQFSSAREGKQKGSSLKREIPEDWRKTG